MRICVHIEGAESHLRIERILAGILRTQSKDEIFLLLTEGEIAVSGVLGESDDPCRSRLSCVRGFDPRLDRNGV